MAGTDAILYPYSGLYIFTDVCFKGRNSSLISPIIKFIVSYLCICVYIKKMPKGFFGSKNRLYFLDIFQTA